MFEEYNEYFVDCIKLVNIQYNKEEKAVIQKGQVVITGTLSMVRDEFTKLLESYGWSVGSKINKNTKYLITNTPDSGTAKNKEADRFNIPKITEKDFYDIMKG